MHDTDFSQSRCDSCSEPAGFITPVGLLCADHAISATLSQTDSEDRWMPVPLHRETTIDLTKEDSKGSLEAARLS